MPFMITAFSEGVLRTDCGRLLLTAHYIKIYVNQYHWKLPNEGFRDIPGKRYPLMPTIS